ncbi:MAG: carbonic anhydrase family protein [Kangiellaceae bacterium]|nr:carbonic anhydrase family protein [Kangiellaceae bacterium]
MRLYSSLLTVFVCGIALTHSPYSQAAESWNYQQSANWGGTCSLGKNQSPLNIDNMIEADLDGFDESYGAATGTIENTGHSAQFNINSGASIEVDDIDFALKQIHFHTPSEHTIDGDSFPMEAHLVHADENGNLAVVAVLFNEDELNRDLAQLWSFIPSASGQSNSVPQPFDLNTLIPDEDDYYRYNGSLTTPPCTEGVRWLVMKEPLTASSGQIGKLQNMFGNNNRPVQPTNARPILE